MPATGPKKELKALIRYVSELESHFISPYLSSRTLAPPKRKESLQVAAYIVLVHGALENFIEGLALWVLSRVVTGWTNTRRTSRSTASILLFHPPPKLDASKHITAFDNLRDTLAAANSSQSTAIKDNNGIALKHVRELFYPLGVDVPNDPVLTASLDSVVSIRHQWAHQYRYGAKVIKSAQDAKTAVDDCLTFARKLSDASAAARP